MPFIRYHTGDIGIAGDCCSCGRSFPIIKNIEGRSIECIITPSGLIISPTTLGHYLFVLKEVYRESFLKFQAIQRTLNKIVFKFVPAKALSNDLLDELHLDLKRLLGDDVEITIEIVDDIPLEKSGKQPIIKSKIYCDSFLQ